MVLLKKIDNFERNEYYEAIAKRSINNITTKFGKLYKDYFYQGKEVFPTLEQAKGTIVLFTRNYFPFNKDGANTQISKVEEIPEMGGCKKRNMQ